MMGEMGKERRSIRRSIQGRPLNFFCTDKSCDRAKQPGFWCRYPGTPTIQPAREGGPCTSHYMELQSLPLQRVSATASEQSSRTS
jgi:hypothetical protein